LTNVDARQSFDKIARTHKRKGWFLSDELERRGIVDQFAGTTRAWRLNIYGLNWELIKYLAQAFHDISRTYGIKMT